jgi:hypothetical protein
MSTRKLTIIETKPLKSGTSSTGKAWTIYDVTAVNEDGSPIEEKLRSFDQLQGTVEVEIERKDDPKYGVSFTLKLPKGAPGAAEPASAGARLGPSVDELRRRVETLEGIVTTLVEKVNAGGTGSPIATPAAAAPKATF